MTAVPGLLLIEAQVAPRWLACEHPERPYDDHVAYHFEGCTGCRLACFAHRMAATDPDRAQRLHVTLRMISPPLDREPTE